MYKLSGLIEIFRLEEHLPYIFLWLCCGQELISTLVENAGKLYPPYLHNIDRDPLHTKHQSSWNPHVVRYHYKMNKNIYFTLTYMYIPQTHSTQYNTGNF